MLSNPGSLSDTAPRFTYPPPVVIPTTLIRKMRGRSQSLLVADSYQNLYILKMGIAPSDFRCLASELIGTGLCHALGLPVPQSCLLQVGDRFLDRYPNAWFHTVEGGIRPPSGLHYGTAFVGAVQGIGRPLDVLPSTSKGVLDNVEKLYGIYLFDVWANHLNRRQKVYLAHPERKAFRAIFIDNGLLFGGPLWSFDDDDSQVAFRRKDAADVEWQSGDVHAWIERFKATIPDAIAHILELVPPGWCPGELANLERMLLHRLKTIEEIVEPFTLAHAN